MMRNSGYHFPRTSAFPGVQPFQNRHGHNRFEGYQFSLLAPPAPRAANRTGEEQPHTMRAIAPSLRPLVARYGHRCPECAGPLVNGEGCVACPVCGFRRQGW